MTDAISNALARGVMPASALRERLGVSRPTLMRMVRAAGSDVIRLGRGPATQYALRQAWPNVGESRFPVIRITEAGVPASAGELITLAATESLWMPAGRVFNGLPLEIVDARPAGFLGRHFAATHADLRLPVRLEDWSDHHILLAMSRRGEDLPGDLIVGDESFARWQALDIAPVAGGDYPALAAATIAGDPPGSSAGGERPKFGAFVDGRHVLVKFAARSGQADRVARRWCDLLVLEGLALDVVRAHGIPAAPTAIVETSSHWFLESERFDRAGARGRVAVLSLAAVHDDLGDSWTRAARALEEAGRLARDDARRLRWLDAFGALIGNTDRHQHNVLFFTDGPMPRLAPAFDQASMFFAPTGDGQVPDRVLVVARATADALDVWDDARAAARELWARGSEDGRLSDEMRAVCARQAGQLGA